MKKSFTLDRILTFIAVLASLFVMLVWPYSGTDMAKEAGLDFYTSYGDYTLYTPSRGGWRAILGR